MLHPRSESKLAGVDDRLRQLVTEAATTCPFDLLVTDGRRSRARQAQLVAAGASQTMDSAHITGEAIDVAAVVGKSVRYDWPLYYIMADHMREAAVKLGIRIRWGGCWDRDLSASGDDAEQMVAGYVARRKAVGKKAFLDGPHLELFDRT